MPYKTPLRKPKVRESVFAHTVTLCWFYIKFKDIKDKITLKKFCDEFEQIVVIGGIWEKVLSEYNIDCDLHKKDGTIHKPDYKKLFGKKGWINLYEWKTQYQHFKADMLIASDDTERERYIRHTRKMNDEDYDSLDECYQRKKEPLTVYENNKNEETITIIDERLRKRNGFDKESTINLNADVDAELTHKGEIAQDIILKPEYVELTRKLLEDVVNDS